MEFTTRYIYNGSEYMSSIFATSWEDAENHLKAKKETEKVFGYTPLDNED